MMIIPQPAKPAAFCCTFLLHKKKIKKAKNKKKLKKISKIQHINIRTKKKEPKKEPKRSRTEKRGEAWKQKKEEVKNERYPK